MASFPAFQKTFKDYCDSLVAKSDKDKRAFFEAVKATVGNSTSEVIISSINELIKTSAKSGARKASGSFKSTVAAFQQYTNIIDTLVQAHPFPTALIWGGLKIVIQCATTYIDQFEHIKDALTRLPEVLWNVTNFEDLYGSSAFIADVAQNILSDFYQTMFDFWYCCVVVLKESPLRNSILKNRNLESLVKKLENDAGRLDKIYNGAEAHLNRQMREITQNMHHGIMDEAKRGEIILKKITENHVISAMEAEAMALERQEAALGRAAMQAAHQAAEEEMEKAAVERKKAEEERKRAEEYRRRADEERRRAEADRKKLDDERNIESLIELLQSKNPPHETNYQRAHSDRHKGTCTWLYSTEEFQEWVMERSPHPVLWLTGRHGAGKSVLCASAIDHVQAMDGNSTTVAYQFFSGNEKCSRNQVLRNICCKLLQTRKRTGSDRFSDSLQHFQCINPDNTTTVEKLVEALLTDLPRTYIFLDGLDEVVFSDTHSLTYQRDLQAILTFLLGQAKSSQDKVRIWLSSQPLPEIRKTLLDLPCLDFVLQTRHTEGDMMEYLGSQIPTHTDDKLLFAKMFLTASMASEVEGSFLWARTMLDHLKKDAHDASELIRLAKGGLPTGMSKVYDKVIERIRRQQEESRSGNSVLWKIVLSLVTFAKRPLRIEEVREAVAMYRTGKGLNLDPYRLVGRQRILDCCQSLVRSTKQGTEDVLELDHSAVRTYLLDRSNLTASDGNELVSSEIIAECCISYLEQPRYNGIRSEQSAKALGDKARSQALLKYAAKYWHLHLDSPIFRRNNNSDEPTVTVKAPDQASISRVRSFLQSPNFQTCLQVQSSFIVGQFLQQFDPITDRITSLKPTLPNWVRTGAHDIHRQFVEFQSEWCHLLQSELSDHNAGSISRCLWNALGPCNFLSKNRQQYHCLSMTLEDTGEEDKSTFMKISPDGERVMLCSVRIDGTFSLATWNLTDTKGSPSVVRSCTSFKPSETRLGQYWFPNPTSFRLMPLLPSGKFIHAPDAVSICPNDFSVRVGSRILLLGSEESSDLVYRVLDKKALGDTWEDLLTSDRYLVVCRRRMSAPQRSTAAVEREKQRKERVLRRLVLARSQDEWKRKKSRLLARFFHQSTKQLIEALAGPMPPDGLGSLGRTDSDLSGDDDDSFGQRFFKGYPSDESSDWSDSDEEALSSMPGSEIDGGSADVSAADESWSEGSSFQETSSEDSIASQLTGDENSVSSGEDLDFQSASNDDGDGDDGAGVDVSDVDSFISASSSHATKASDNGSILSHISISQHANSEPESDEDESDDDDARSDANQIPILASEPDYPISITKPKGQMICDGCRRVKLRTYFHCRICVSDNFDLCNNCIRRGKWCLDKTHQLYKLRDRQLVGVTSSKNLAVGRQEIAVYRKEGREMRPVFRVKRNYESFLYHSPPVIHPHHELVAWPLTGGRVLFANLDGNTYFEQKIKAIGQRKAQQICIDMSFSPSGHFLRLATIEATMTKPRKLSGPTSQSPDEMNTRTCLDLRVQILRLSPTKPTRNPPKLAATMRFGLGCWPTEALSQFPFAFTWCADHLYLTISDTCLSVYQIALESLQKIVESASGARTIPKAEALHAIKKMKECIFLPRSSRHRTVQYFPPREAKGRSTIIIGPRNGPSQSPPIALFLAESDFGGWVPIPKEGVGAARCSVSQDKLGGQLEDFNQELDCDFIPV